MYELEISVQKNDVMQHTLHNIMVGGDEEDRTLDLTDANRTLSQLSYAPKLTLPLTCAAKIIIALGLLFGKGCTEKNLKYLHELSVSGLNTSYCAFKNGKSACGESISASGCAASSTDLSRNPQVQATENTPAFFAVKMSTSESPI